MKDIRFFMIPASLVFLYTAILAGNTAAKGPQLHFEAGFLSVMDHKIQFSKNGTYFDYDDNGGQDNLFFVKRYSIDLPLNERHTVTFLYQPLLLETDALLDDSLVVDSLVYPAGTPVRFRYGFPFYRLSYLYDLWPEAERELGIGISLQIRNATINFTSLDGTLFRSKRDIGPVPILKVRWRQPLSGAWWAGAEADGFYAPISYLNGSDEEVTGAILDASLRFGRPVAGRGDIFLNIRYLGGGAAGTSDDDLEYGDGYVKNWLHFLTLTLGFSFGI